ncbi:MAG: aldo/keto reductase [Oscillospiraceae bacterium]|jgi:predicted aldo/keto reductase-like oxidoreductase|nr:aldo/keto reductase [Oscillospiraceae bacterium]
MPDTYLGESVKKLGFGLMRLPRVEGGQDFDLEQIKKMVDHFLANGYTYFDTAYVYGGSEEATREALVKRHPRDKYTIASKLNLNAALGGGMGFGGPPQPAAAPPSREEAQKKMLDQFETTLSRLGTDYLDFYLLHGLGGATIKTADDVDAWGFVRSLKEQGRIRHYGLSFHGTPEELDGVFTAHPDAEFVQLQINYLDWEDERVQSGKCYAVARKHNKPVTVMEPIKGGQLANENAVFAKHFKTFDADTSAASWALRFVADLPGLVAILSGMSTYEQLVDNVNTFNGLKPLSDADRKAIADARNVIASVPRVPCTACNYCKDCPQKINIAQMFNLYNDFLVYGEINERMYGMMTGAPSPFNDRTGKPSDCVSCKSCENECPQHIEISSLMEKIAAVAPK